MKLPVPTKKSFLLLRNLSTAITNGLGIAEASCWVECLRSYRWDLSPAHSNSHSLGDFSKKTVWFGWIGMIPLKLWNSLTFYGSSAKFNNGVTCSFLETLIPNACCPLALGTPQVVQHVLHLNRVVSQYMGVSKNRGTASPGGAASPGYQVAWKTHQTIDVLTAPDSPIYRIRIWLWCMCICAYV